MSQRIVINALDFAREAGLLQGKLPTANLTRTLDLLADPAGVLSYKVEGRFGSRKRPQLVVSVEGTLSVCCKRCLEGIDYPLSVYSVLEFVGIEEELSQEEIEDDSRDFLTEQNEVDVIALIEDEVILDLPVAPRHDSCALPEAWQGSENASPFSVLKGLKSKA